MKRNIKEILKLVRWSEEDNCFVGSLPDICGDCCHGKDEVEVYKQLRNIAEDWVSIYNEDNEELPEPLASKEFSGTFTLRVGRDLHQKVALKASLEDRSINNYLEDLIRKI